MAISGQPAAFGRVMSRQYLMVLPLLLSGTTKTSRARGGRSGANGKVEAAMFTMHVKYHATTQEILFPTRDQAEAALAALAENNR